MNAPIREFGRYQLAVTDVLAIQKETGWRRFFTPSWKVSLRNGTSFRFNAKEHELLVSEMNSHENVVAVASLIQRMPLLNRPA